MYFLTFYIRIKILIYYSDYLFRLFCFSIFYFFIFIYCRPELDKPASSVYPHNISSILETGIRATVTKIDDSDTHKRLDVRLLAPSENERGWDIFILDYNVGGPIGTVCMKT